ncbi:MULTISPECIES: acyl-CoA dehydrogenase family protein [unclassified Sphingomonas]|uniref:acyl-CoA dehydrogenase family protein n=1 Tax=unclassified Sphingomonas TaxID=196159 RepID=UPI00138F8188|nr:MULTISPECIES: acyl-CoA dehydrogenase family protein [unclassified Sphingomonas]
MDNLQRESRAIATEVPSSDDLLYRARQLGPLLRERAKQCEEGRRMPPETFAAFKEAGFYRILQPKAYGGYEYWPTVFYDVVSEIARHCPSSAWALGIIGIHNWEVALMDPRAAKDLWSRDTETFYSSSYAPFGKARRVEGGYEVEGRWGWSSGCDQATWVILGALVEMEDGEVNHLALLVESGDYEIDHSSWNSVGLTGSGSKDIVVRGAFVPAYRVHNISRTYQMRDPGRVIFTADTYKLAFGTVFAFVLTSVLVGIADGALDFYVDYIAKRTNAYNGSSFKQDALAQQILADAHSLVDGAHLRLKRNFDEMAAFVSRGEEIPLARRVFYKWDAANIAKQCRDAVNMLTHACGGSVFDADVQMQRYFRDANVGANHLFINHQKSSVNFGAFMLSGQNSDLML